MQLVRKRLRKIPNTGVIMREALEELTAATKHATRNSSYICKPCWEIKYCPYGQLVEQFPLPPPTREEAIKRNEF
jgi:transcription initiation factor IIE alpha subunit